jgi:hypothetical protein
MSKNVPKLRKLVNSFDIDEEDCRKVKNSCDWFIGKKGHEIGCDILL